MSGFSGEEGPNVGTIPALADLALKLRETFPGPVSGVMDIYNVLSDSLGEKRLSRYSYEKQREETVQLHSLLGWVSNGMPVFDLTHSLMAALLLTDPSDVPADMVKLPFSSFVVRLPQPFWKIKGDTGLELPANFVLVHTYESPTMEMNLATQSLNVVGGEPRIVNRIVTKDSRTQVWERRNPFPESGKIAPWVEDEIPAEFADEIPEDVPLEETDKHLITAFRRLLVNLCLYIAERGRGEKLGGKRAAKAAGLLKSEPMPEPQIWVLGREIKLDRELVESAKAWTEAKAGRTAGWKIRSRFTVRGHWRNQAHGPGRTEHTLKWIAPYWKGSEGPALSHVYKLSEK